MTEIERFVAMLEELGIDHRQNDAAQPYRVVEVMDNQYHFWTTTGRYVYVYGLKDGDKSERTYDPDD